MRHAPQSFERYAEERFGFKRSYCLKLRGAAAVADVIWSDAYNCTHSLTNAEGTIRPLTRLLPRRSDDVEQEHRDRIEAAWARA